MAKLFSTDEAAAQLGLTASTIKYHYKLGNIKGTKIGHSLVFTQAQIDSFNASRRRVGRPPKIRR